MALRGGLTGLATNVATGQSPFSLGGGLAGRATEFGKENKIFKEDNKNLKNDHDSMKNDYDLMKKDLSEHKSFTRKLSILYKEGVKKLDSFAQQKDFWEKKAEEREKQLKEAKRLEKELRTWVSDLEISEGDKNSKFKNSSPIDEPCFKIPLPNTNDVELSSFVSIINLLLVWIYANEYGIGNSSISAPASWPTL